MNELERTDLEENTREEFLLNLIEFYEEIVSKRSQLNKMLIDYIKSGNFESCNEENTSEYIKDLTEKLIHYQKIVPDYSKDEKGFYLIQGVSLGIQMAISYLEKGIL